MKEDNQLQVTSNHRLILSTYSLTARTDLSGARAMVCLVAVVDRSPKIITSNRRLIHQLLEKIHLEHVL